MQRSRFLLSVIGTVFALGASFGGVAAAEPTRVARSAIVEYAGLDLGSGVAIEQLYARLAAAAERVCGDYDLRQLRARRAWRACYEAALADAVALLPHPALVDRHRSERERRAAGAAKRAAVG